MCSDAANTDALLAALLSELQLTGDTPMDEVEPRCWCTASCYGTFWTQRGFCDEADALLLQPEIRAGGHAAGSPASTGTSLPAPAPRRHRKRQPLALPHLAPARANISTPWPPSPRGSVDLKPTSASCCARPINWPREHCGDHRVRRVKADPAQGQEQGNYCTGPGKTDPAGQDGARHHTALPSPSAPAVAVNDPALQAMMPLI